MTRRVLVLSAVAVTALVAVVVGLYGFAGSTPPTGPLGQGSAAADYGQCVHGTSGTLGWQLRHRTPLTVTITRIQLSGSRDLRLIGAEIVPLRRDSASIGALLGYPPTKRDLRGDGDMWRKRKTVPVTIRLGGQRRYDVVLGIKRLARAGVVSGANVFYSVHGRQYVLPTREHMKVAAGR